jgi:hypothetical protein
VAHDPDARTTLRFIDVAVGPSRTLELAASSGESAVAFRALTAQGSIVAEGTITVTAGSSASGSLANVAAGDLVDLELELGGGLELRAFRLG